MTDKEYVQQRIDYAKSNIKFWKGDKAIQQVWIGIKIELELLKRKLE
jgi:hypothetical protein